MPILMFAIAALLGAMGQFLYKEGSQRIAGSIQSYFNVWILGGVFCYIGVMVLFVAAFKRGGSPSILYPVYASTFIWAAVIAAVFYGLPIRPVHVAGMILIIAGMYFMGH